MSRTNAQFGSGEGPITPFRAGQEISATFGDQPLEKGDARAGEDWRRDSFEFNCHAHRRGWNRCEAAGRITPALFIEDEDLAAGVLASPLAKILADTTGAQCDQAGRIKVKPDRSLPGHPEVFVVGDMMNCNDLPGVAEVALQSGLYAVHVIRNPVKNGAEPTPLKYWDFGGCRPS